MYHTKSIEIFHKIWDSVKKICVFIHKNCMQVCQPTYNIWGTGNFSRTLLVGSLYNMEQSIVPQSSGARFTNIVDRQTFRHEHWTVLVTRKYKDTVPQ